MFPGEPWSECAIALFTPTLTSDPDIVWKTAVEEVPGLLPRLRELLEQVKKGGS
jgi:uncharacterized protein with HEPN domain